MSDKSSSDESLSHEDTNLASCDDGESFEGNSDACFNEVRQRAEKLRRKYSLDDKITQSNDNQLSKIECLLLILSFSMRHALNDAAIGDLLKFVNDIMGQEVIPESKLIFDNLFSFDCGVEYHFYCLKCEIIIGKYSDL